MQKLRLDPEQLKVETFATRRGGEPARGTVRGHDDTVYSCPDPTLYACNPTDKNYDTCDISCWYMCFPSDDDTCWC